MQGDRQITQSRFLKALRAALLAGGSALALSAMLAASPAQAAEVAPTANGDRCALLGDPVFAPGGSISGPGGTFFSTFLFSPNTFTQNATGSPNNLACGAFANASGVNSTNSAVGPFASALGNNSINSAFGSFANANGNISANSASGSFANASGKQQPERRVRHGR